MGAETVVEIVEVDVAGEADAEAEDPGGSCCERSVWGGGGRVCCARNCDGERVSARGEEGGRGSPRPAEEIEEGGGRVADLESIIFGAENERDDLGGGGGPALSCVVSCGSRQLSGISSLFVSGIARPVGRVMLSVECECECECVRV